MSDLRRIGLVGGTSWASTALYYRLLNESVAERVGGAASAPVIVWSVDFADVAALQHAGEWDALGDLLADAARRLQDAGATAVALAANTLHLVADQVRTALDVPLVDIVDVTARAVAGHRRVGLLGTAFTMDSPLFADRLAQDGVEVIVPEPADRALVHDVIYSELTRGVIRPESRAAYRGVIARLVDRGAEAVVLACTEIGLLVDDSDATVALYDTALLHCAALTDVMVGSLTEVAA